MKDIKKNAALLLASLLIAGQAAPAVSAEPRFSKKTITLEVGETADLELLDRGKYTHYSVSNGYVFSYDKDSRTVTAKSPGTAYIYAESDGEKAQCRIIVNGEQEEKTAAEDTDDRHYDKNVRVLYGKSKIISAPAGKDVVVKLDNSSIAHISCGVIKNDSFDIIIRSKLPGKGFITVCERQSGKVLYTVKLTVYRTQDLAEEEKGSDLDADTYADEVIIMVNEERNSRGLPSLEKSGSLCKSAAVRADEVSRKFSHVRPDGTACYTAITEYYSHSGENIARRVSTAEDVMEAWMDSPRHKDNILDEGYTKIGVAYDPDNRVWVQIFTD